MSSFSRPGSADPVHGRRAVLALFTVLLTNGLPGVPPASAQPGPSKPAPAPTAAPPVPAEPGTTLASFGDWVVRRQRLGEGESATRVCEAAQVMQVQGQSAPIAQVAIRRAGGNAPLRVAAMLPAAVSFPSSMRILAGEKAAPALELPWRHCLPGGCVADAPAPDELLTRWRGADKPGRLTGKDATGREIGLPLSTRGLGPALDALAKERF